MHNLHFAGAKYTMVRKVNVLSAVNLLAIFESLTVSF